MIGDARIVRAIVAVNERIVVEARAGNAVTLLAWSLWSLLLMQWLQWRWRRFQPGRVVVRLGAQRIATVEIEAGSAVISVSQLEASVSSA